MSNAAFQAASGSISFARLHIFLGSTSRPIVRPSTQRVAALIAALALALTQAAAAEYSWQVTGSRQIVEAGDQVDGDTSTVAATYFFKPISEDLGPTALGAFLSRSSSISLGGYQDALAQHRTIGSVTSSITATLDTNADGMTLSGRYVWRESGWYAGGGIDAAEVELKLTSVPDTDVGGYRVFGGKYLGASTSIQLSVRSSTTTSDYLDSLVCLYRACIEQTTLETDEIAVQALHVGDLGAMQYSVSGGISTRDGTLAFTERPFVPRTPPFPPFPPNIGPVGGFVAIVLINVPLATQQDESSDEVDTYSVAGELFPTPRLGVRVGYTSWDGDALREDGYELAATCARLAPLAVANS